jgi:hypothetical protein
MSDPFHHSNKGDPPELDFIPERAIRIAGADPKYVGENCPEDIGNLVASGTIGIGSWAYNTVMFAVAATHFNGSFNLGLLAGSAALAGYTLANDSYVFNRCAHLMAGFQQIGEPIPRKFAKMARRSLGLRVLQSLFLGSVFSVSTSLVLYKDDIATRIRQDWLQAHSARVGQVSTQTDGDINTARDAVNHTMANIAALNKQISARLARSPNAANSPQVNALVTQRAAEQRNLTTEKAGVVQLESHRNETLRADFTEDPTIVRENFGQLAQVHALEEIAGDDYWVALVVFMIDCIFMGFDLAPVLAKLNWLPTTYAALKARDYLERMREIDDERETPRPPGSGNQPARGPANNNGPFGGGQAANDNYPPVAKRGRGRPRKPVVMTNGSGEADSEEE